jgi:hypothetical protein
MGKKLDKLNEDLISFIKKQPLFFVGTAAAEGSVNVSPKGIDTFRVISDSKIAWLNLTGSGNETAAHLIKNPRMTILFCAFEGAPLILRLYGKAKIYHPRDEEFVRLKEIFANTPGARQIIEMDIDLVQSSCGFAVPLMDFKAQRDILTDWADKKGEEGIQEYWNEKNQVSLDGFQTLT